MKTLGKAIDEETETIEMLEDKIKAKKAQSVSLKEDIVELAKNIDDLEAAADKAKKIRKETADLYEEANKDYKSTIKAIADAIKELDSSKAGAFVAFSPKVQAALALAEASSTDEAKRGMLSALLQKPKRPKFEAKGDLKKHVKTYDFKSNNVIELLKELKLKFEDESTEATKDETNSLNAYELEKKARDAETAAAKTLKDEKTELMGKVESDLVQLKSDLDSTQEDKEADTKNFGDTEKACAVKEREWEERSEVRKNEIEAMAMAVKILAKVSGVRTEAPDNPGLPASPVKDEGSSLLSIGIHSFLQTSEDPAQRAINLLRATAQVTHSKVLERIAQQITLNKGAPFQKVINMIEKMIFRLMDEQTSEDKHKNWCDKELSQTKTSKENKQDKIKELSADIDKLSGTIQDLAEQIKAAQEMIAKITTFMKEATEIRETGKAENAEAIKDSEDAQDAVASATSVLETFYKESGMIEKEAYELMQKPVKLPDDPKTWDSSYTGVADPTKANSGVISVLKAVASDFAKMEADTRAQEETDQKAYDEEMSSSEIEKSRRAKENEMKSSEKRRLVEKMEETKKSKKHFSNELEAVNQYLKDLEPACVEGDSSYEDRKKARDKEIEALRKAQDILQDAFKAKPEDKDGKFMLTQLKKTSGFLH
jgi:DNA repair exonuclease SbcCD ATPase subunit